MSVTLTSTAPRQQYIAGEQLTEISHAQEADINYIVDQFTRTGVLLHNKQYEGEYGEFISGDLYQRAQDALATANSMFESLPQNVRKDFKGGTAEFLNFIMDENNRSEIEAYGLTTDHLGPLEPIPEPLNPTPAPPTESPSEGLTDALSE